MMDFSILAIVPTADEIETRRRELRGAALAAQFAAAASMETFKEFEIAIAWRELAKRQVVIGTPIEVRYTNGETKVFKLLNLHWEVDRDYRRSDLSKERIRMFGPRLLKSGKWTSYSDGFGDVAAGYWLRWISPEEKASAKAGK